MVIWSSVQVLWLHEDSIQLLLSENDLNTNTLIERLTARERIVKSIVDILASGCELNKSK